MKKLLPAVLLAWSTATCPATGAVPAFTPVQPSLFATPGALSNAWGDFDNDGDPDLIVTFEAAPVRLYRNDPGGFVEVARDFGLSRDAADSRSVPWGDYDNDGDLDLYIGYSGHQGPANRLYRNDLESGRAGFTEMGASGGAAVLGLTRQVAFVDYDADGDVDLYVALRDAANLMLQNDAGVFTDVSEAIGLFEPRRTVGACWFDFDQDGDLDLFTANQNGDRDGLFRNDHGQFRDIAAELNMDNPRRPVLDGSVGCAVTDFDTDGDLDLYVAAYGADMLYRNNGDGTFIDVAADMGVAVPDHMVSGAWGDVQHDGRPDLYTVGYVWGAPGRPDYLFSNNGPSFADQMPEIIRQHDADHGVQWADFDRDGDLDLALTNSDPGGSHYVFRNDLPPADAGRSIQVLVLDTEGHFTRAGSEVRIYEPGTSRLLGLRMVDTGGGYNSQNAMPVHIGLAKTTLVNVRITTMSPQGPQAWDFMNIDP
ncbi:MAG: CRTAC1 family protein, partial [Lysobacterales bacterium]